MKKLFLSACAVALLSIGSMAQVQDEDTTSTNTGLRQDMPSQDQPSDQADTTQTGDETLTQPQDQPAQDQPAQDQPAQDQPSQDQPTDDMRPQEDATQPEDTTSMASSNAIPTANNVPAAEVEVLASKEGPEGEIVYKHNNEVFYVDRDEAKIVKAKESELRDAKHEVEIKSGAEPENDTKAKKKTKG